jgi:large subunit ribosomal protein L4
MAEAKVLDIKGKEIDKINLDDKIFNTKVKPDLMHEIVTAYLNNQRQGTKSTKSRSMVRGTSQKPYRQKGTGRARAGSMKSPVRRGGGHTFALTGKKYSVRIPKTKKRAALKSALSSKYNNNEIIIIEDFNIDEIKTKQINEIFQNISVFDSVLLVTPEYDEKIYKSARNIAGTKITVSNDLNTYEVLKYKFLVLKQSSVKKIEELLK